MKAAALLLGPAGVGVIALYQGMISVAATVFGLGLRTVGTQFVADAMTRGDQARIGLARRALFWATLFLSLLGAAAFWLFRHALAASLSSGGNDAATVGWLAIGVAASVASSSQLALLTGLRRMNDLARLMLASSALNALLGIAVLVAFRAQAIVAFVLLGPIASLALGYWYASRVGAVLAGPTDYRAILLQCGTMARLGFAFMITGAFIQAAEFLVRVIVSQKLGAADLGQFQAAWTISVTYAGIVLGAMSADFYPRLVGVMADHTAANQLINQQTEIALLLAGPICLAVIATAPWVIELLYSPEFRGAATVLRWQVLGDILKVASWPLGYAILSSGRAWSYFWVEGLTIVVFVCFTLVTLPLFGINAPGVGVFVMYAVYLPLAYWLSRQRAGFTWTRQIKLYFAALILTASLTFLLSAWADLAGAAFGVIAAAVAAAYAIGRLSALVEPTEQLRALSDMARRLAIWFGIFWGAAARARQNLLRRRRERDVGATELVAAGKDHLAHRRDIDGLRAVAVLSVVIFHAAPGRLPGGFVGVDIFFVISGFLITAIIVADLDRHRFSFVEFYMRRIRRIFPALALVLLACLLAGVLALTSDELLNLGEHIAAGASFVSNLALWNESGYFDGAADFKPLLHLWSLGVEEQFYIFWPLAVLLLFRFGHRALSGTILVAAISFLFSQHQVNSDPVGAFYSPLSRFWELMVGAAVACWLAKAKSAPSALTANLLSAAGVAAVLAALLLIDQTKSFPGWWAIAPTFGAALLIWAGPRAWFNRNVLSRGVAVWFGAISYPLYLWHWPLLALPRIMTGDEIPQWQRAAAIGVAIVLAWLTFRFVETPIRRRPPSRAFAASLFASVCAIGIAGAILFAENGWPSRPWGPTVANSGDIGAYPFFNYVERRFYPCTPLDIRRDADDGSGYMRCPQSRPDGAKDIVLVGDSHAEALFPGLASALSEKNIAYYGAGSGLPLAANPDYSKIFSFVTADPNIRTVLLAAAWNRKLKLVPIEVWRKQLAETITVLTRAGKRLYLVDDVPQFSFMPMRCKYANRLGRPLLCDEPDDASEQQYIPVFDAVAATAGVRVVSVRRMFCDTGVCSRAADGELLFRDTNHLTIAGSIRAADALRKQINFE